MVVNTGDNNVIPIAIPSNRAGAPITVGRSPFDIAITPLAAPTNVVGKITKNIFLNRTERVLSITWNASTTAGVVAYNIYRDGELITSVSALRTLMFVTSLCSCADVQRYSVAAVVACGSASFRAPVVS